MAGVAQAGGTPGVSTVDISSYLGRLPVTTSDHSYIGVLHAHCWQEGGRYQEKVDHHTGTSVLMEGIGAQINRTLNHQRLRLTSVWLLMGQL